MGFREALAIALLLVPLAARAEVDRFAVVFGNDVGEGQDARLSYAEEDAMRFGAALEQVSGVRPENLVVLRGQDAATVRRTLIAVNDRVRAAGRQAMLIVYYSGHADAGALHLGATPLELPELEQLVRGSAASFRLLVVDACRSGALTRVKGGAPVPPFEIRLDEKAPGEGAVFLTSSSASEDSQESDALKGSFFTHALISGLLGAADENGDGKVTLDEAYRYAYDATLRATSRTLFGTQHPTFEYEVRGIGDVVLSTLDAGPQRAFIDFPPERSWLLFKQGEEGAVVGEVAARDRARRLSVRPGRYFVRGRAPDVLLEGALDVPAGAQVRVDESVLHRTQFARLVRKGAGDSSSALSLELEGRARSTIANDATACPGAAAGLAFALRSFTLTPRFGWCRGGFDNGDLRATLDEYDLDLTAAHVWDLRALSLEAGVTLGGALFSQRFRTGGVAPRRTTSALVLSPLVGAERDLTASSYLFLTASAATYLFKSEDAQQATSFSPSFAVRFSLGLALRL